MSDSSKPSKINPAIRLRADMINATCDVSSDTKDFMSETRRECAELVERVLNKLPADHDVGRVIAFIDSIKRANNEVYDAVILGAEAANRKRKAPEGV